MPYRQPSSRSMQVPLSPAPRGSWVRRFGRRNVGYILFVIAMIGLAIAIEGRDPATPEESAGVGLAIMVWGAGSVGFFVINAVFVAMDLANHRSPRKAAIACALPIGLMLGLIILAQFIA